MSNVPQGFHLFTDKEPLIKDRYYLMFIKSRNHVRGIVKVKACSIVPILNQKYVTIRYMYISPTFNLNPANQYSKIYSSVFVEDRYFKEIPKEHIAIEAVLHNLKECL